MNETKEEVKPEEPKKKEELIDTAMRVIKKDHNWKFLAGMIIWFILSTYVF
jgi:hypothetical protein